MEKHFITAEDLLRDSFELGLRVAESNYRPTFIIGLWRGGSPIAIAIQELLDVLGQSAQHAAVRTASYGGGTVSRKVEVFGHSPIIESLSYNDRVLIVDDTFDTGRSVAAVVDTLRAGQVNCEIKLATIYYKPTLNKTDRQPDFYIHETDQWLVFPHELRGATLGEIKARGILPERAFKRDFKL